MEWVLVFEVDFCIEIGFVGVLFNKLFDYVDSFFVVCQKNEEQMWWFVVDVSYELCILFVFICGYFELLLCVLWQVLDFVQSGEVIEGIMLLLECIQVQLLWMIWFVEDLLFFVWFDEGWEFVYGMIDLIQFVFEGFLDVWLIVVDYYWKIDVFDEFVMIVGDVGRMYQVVVNFLVNVCIYILVGMIVILSVVWEGDDVVLWVYDDGLGIDFVICDELFVWFVCGDSFWVWQIGGIGFGFVIVKVIVEGYYGFIMVESVFGDIIFIVCIFVEFLFVFVCV